MKSSELLRKLKKNGWKVLRQGKGSHVILEHATKGEMSFPDHGSKEVPTGMEKKIKKLGGL